MNTATSMGSDREERFHAVLLPLLQALEKGETPDREKVLAAHPEFREELIEFFAGRDCLQRLIEEVPRGVRPGDPTGAGLLTEERPYRSR